MRAFVKTARAGGVEQAISPPGWDEDAALERELDRCWKELRRELEMSGRLVIGEKRKDGDYTTRRMVLLLPD